MLDGVMAKMLPKLNPKILRLDGRVWYVYPAKGKWDDAQNKCSSSPNDSGFENTTNWKLASGNDLIQFWDKFKNPISNPAFAGDLEGVTHIRVTDYGVPNETSNAWAKGIFTTERKRIEWYPIQLDEVIICVGEETRNQTHLISKHKLDSDTYIQLVSLQPLSRADAEKFLLKYGDLSEDFYNTRELVYFISRTNSPEATRIKNHLGNKEFWVWWDNKIQVGHIENGNLIYRPANENDISHYVIGTATSSDYYLTH